MFYWVLFFFLDPYETEGVFGGALGNLVLPGVPSGDVGVGVLRRGGVLLGSRRVWSWG